MRSDGEGRSLRRRSGDYVDRRTGHLMHAEVIEGRVADALAALVAQRRDLDRKIAMQVDSLVKYGAGWPKIAAALGVTHQVFGMSGSDLRLSGAASPAPVHPGSIARMWGSTSVPRHHGSRPGIAHTRNKHLPPVGLELRAGCCPEPVDDGEGSVRYEIYGNVFKGARDDEGKLVPGGKPRDLPWTVIPPVVHAIRVLERLAGGIWLFPLKTSWNSSGSGPPRRTGDLLTPLGARRRIEAFIT